MVSVTVVSTNKKRRILIIVGVIALLVLAGAAGMGARWLQNKNEANAKKEASLAGKQSSGFSKEIDELQTLRAAGYNDAANQKIQEALKDPSTPKAEQYQLYIQQGNAYIDKQDLTAAIAAYEKAEALDATYTITTTLARTWADAGNKAKAIEYYRKALALVPDGPLQDDYKASIDKIIRNLEGRP